MSKKKPPKWLTTKRPILTKPAISRVGTKHKGGW